MSYFYFVLFVCWVLAWAGWRVPLPLWLQLNRRSLSLLRRIQGMRREPEHKGVAYLSVDFAIAISLCVRGPVEFGLKRSHLAQYRIGWHILASEFNRIGPESLTGNLNTVGKFSVDNGILSICSPLTSSLPVVMASLHLVCTYSSSTVTPLSHY